MTDVPPAATAAPAPDRAGADRANADRAGAGGPGAALAGCRVLELSHSAAAVAGRVLADLGAEVIKLEPPGGEQARQAEPAFDGPDGQRHSFAFLAFNLGKRSVTVDTGSAAGREILTRLAAASDIVLTDWERSGSPEEADRLRTLCSAANPRLVFCEIWPYGRGEYQDTAATDLTIQAQGGHLYLNGDTDRPPVRISAPVAVLAGGVEAASAALMAYYHALRTGEGQQVDVSLQACIIWTLLNTTMTWQCMDIDEIRGGAVKKERGNSFFTRLVWPCKDGFIQFGPVGGGGGKARDISLDALIEWMREEGFFDEILLAHDWNGPNRFSVPQRAYDAVTEVIGAFIATRTVDELIERGMKRRILLAPIYTVPQLLQAEQLTARGFFRAVPDDRRGATALHPGPFARLSETPLVELRPAPDPGADTTAVLAAAGLTPTEISALRRAEVI